MGHRFLRHIERNSILLFLVPADSDDIVKEYEVLLAELKQYNPEMLFKDRVLAISKSDMLDEELTNEIQATLPQDLENSFHLLCYGAKHTRTEGSTLENVTLVFWIR